MQMSRRRLESAYVVSLNSDTNFLRPAKPQIPLSLKPQFDLSDSMTRDQSSQWGGQTDTQPCQAANSWAELS